MDQPIFLLGAGASVEAGIPSALHMTRRIDAHFQELHSETAARILRFVVGGLQMSRGASGDDPFSDVDVEAVFAALAMLGMRHQLDVAPFIAQWHPLLDAFDQSRMDRWDRHHIESRAERTFTPRPTRNPNYRSNAPFVPDGRDVVELLEAAYDAFSKPPIGLAFQDTADRMLVTLKSLVWIDDYTRVQYLSPLLSSSSRITIATLNYDNTVELLCQNCQVEYTTGLEEWRTRGVLTPPDTGIEVLKLHGSIDWVWDGAERGEGRFASYRFPHRSVRPVEDFKRERFVNPALVFGSGQKLRSEGPFLELLRTFRLRLDASRHIIVVGYSFRDDHVNNIIFGWLGSSSHNRITIIDKPGSKIEDLNYGPGMQRELGDRVRFIGSGAAAGLQQVSAAGQI